MPENALRYSAATSLIDAHQPRTSLEAQHALIEGNRRFASWMQSCRVGGNDHGHELVVPGGGGLSAIASFAPHEYPEQKPFAAVVGCSDARAPAELIFGQGYNDIFVVRNAGNVLSDVVMGSIDFTLHALSDSVRVIVVLGHTSCGGVRGAVNAYLHPTKYWSKATSPSLRSIYEKIFVAVREADDTIREVWGPDAPERPEYLEALIETSVSLNAAHTAFTIRQEVENEARSDFDVLYAVYDVRTHLVRKPNQPFDGDPQASREFSYAPNHPRELAALARDLATALKPGASARSTAQDVI